MLGNQPGRGVETHDLPVVDDRDAIADGLSFLHRMRGEQNAAATLPQMLDSLPKLAARLGIETGGWLVEQDQRRVVHCGDQQREPLLLAAGQLAETLAGLLLEMDRRQVFVGRGLRSRSPIEAGVEAHQLANRQFLLKAGRLELHPYLCACVARPGACIDAIHDDGARCRLDQAFDRAERAGFPGAVGTEEAEDLSLVDRERHALDSGR